jgi:hypothetical protein
MKWRYQNHRIVLYRPVLLNLANRGNQDTPSQEEIATVGKCRAIAKQTIEDITREWKPNQMSGWNGVWFMYQASMIPLLSIFWESWNAVKVREWQSQIEVVMEAFEGMADWSLAARRSREVVLKMYDASKRPLTRQGSPKLVPSGANGQTVEGEMAQMEMEEKMVLLDHQSIWDLDGMLWGNLPNGLDIPFDGMQSLEFEDPSAGSYDGIFMMHQ